MKTVSKVFIIIGIVLGFWMIFPIPLGIIAYKKLDGDCDTNDFLIWGIVTLILVSQIAGILMIVMFVMNHEKNVEAVEEKKEEVTPEQEVIDK